MNYTVNALLKIWCSDTERAISRFPENYTTAYSWSVGLEYGNNKEVQTWFTKEGVFIKMDIRKTKKFNTVGELMHVHRTQVWK